MRQRRPKDISASFQEGMPLSNNPKGTVTRRQSKPDLSVVIAFANQKGGVGKTTSCVNIAACVGALEKKTLLIDMDPQGNTTSGVGISKKSIRFSSYDLLSGEEKDEAQITKTRFANLDIIPTTISLAGAEFELVNEKDREYIFKNGIAGIRDEYDYVFIDCPPSLGILTINVLTAADSVIIPMQCEYYSLEGLSQLMITIKKIKQLYNPGLDLCGILITMFNGRLNLSAQVLKEVKKYYSDKLFSVPVARNVKLSEAPGFGEPVIYHDKYSKGAQNYMDVAQELIERTRSFAEGSGKE